MDALARKLEALRTARGVSVREVARSVGATYSTCPRWFDGRSVPRLDEAMRLADYFGISLDELVGRSTTRLGLTEAEVAILAAAKGLPLATAIERLTARGPTVIPPKIVVRPDQTPGRRRGNGSG